MVFMKKANSSILPMMALFASAIAIPERARADSSPYLGEIAAASIYGFCPRGWASADGQLLAISQSTALFSLIGTTFGGDGRVTFALPDLRGRIPIGEGTGPGLSQHFWGEKAGHEAITLTQDQMASHSHLVNATNADGDKPGPGGKVLAAAPTGGTGTETIYSDQPANRQMSSAMISPSGSNAPVNVEDPTLVIRYCIALVGTFPPRE